MSAGAPVIMIVAGEASGDMHGARLVAAMRAMRPALSFSGIGGRELAAVGTELLFDADKIAVVRNGVNMDFFSPRPRNEALAREHGLEGKFVAGFLGTLGMAHALDKVLEAAALLRDRDDIRILLVGSGASRPQCSIQVLSQRWCAAELRCTGRSACERGSVQWPVHGASVDCRRHADDKSAQRLLRLCDCRRSAGNHPVEEVAEPLHRERGNEG